MWDMTLTTLQSDIGPITPKNQPPRFVMLDDRAVFEVLNSDIPKAKMAQNWPHEFGGPAKVRTRRPHRGRPAIKDDSAEGDQKYHSTLTASGKETYPFTGEKDFQPIFYRYEPQPQWKPKRKRMPSPTSEEYNPRGHGHNQYTPKDMLVKNGAATFSLKEKKNYPPRPSTLVPTVPTPPFSGMRDRTSSRELSAGMSSEDGIMAGIQNEESVKKMADQLFKANEKIELQAREIEHLKKVLAAQEYDSLQLGVKRPRVQAAQDDEESAQQHAAEIAKLKEEVKAGKAKEAELQDQIDCLRRGQWWQG